MEAANQARWKGRARATAPFGLAIHLPSESDANPFVNKAFRHRTFFAPAPLHPPPRFIVLPGGIGTALELFMVWQLIQVKHVTEHPLILVGTMWTGLIDWINEVMITRGLASPQDMNAVSVVSSYEEAIPIIRASYERFIQEKKNAQ
jgi:predicted Rossmann-fold nucleotide-binding protein